MRHGLVARLLTVAVGAALAGCGSANSVNEPARSASFTLGVAPGQRTVSQGDATNYTVTLTAENGFSKAVSPTVTGLPAGAKASFQPASVVPTAVGASATMTVTTTAVGGAAAPTPAGTSNLTVTAVSGAINRQSDASLTVTAPPPPGSLQGAIQ